MNAPVKTDNAELIVPEGVFAETVLSVTHYTDHLFRFRMTRPAGFRFRSGVERTPGGGGSDWLGRTGSIFPDAQFEA